MSAPVRGRVEPALLAQISRRGIELLRSEDPVLHNLLELETRRQTDVLMMVAASSIAHPSVLACAGAAATNVTTEGYPGARFHAGCTIVDEIERLAIERAKIAFHARYANVQPHSGSSANAAVIFSLLRPGDTILGMDLAAGGHLTHGAKASVIGQYFHAIGYGVDHAGRIDYDRVRDLARRFRPRLIICGASAYPRVIDFACFRAIADDVGAYVLADISHVAGLVVTGEHPSPIDHAHFTTTSTYKQLYGPRGGLILMGQDAEDLAPDGKGTLAEMIQRAVFPFFQGTPDLAAIAAKARALDVVASPEFRCLTGRILAAATALASALAERGYRVVSGGTDNHMVLVDVMSTMGLSGVVAQQALEACNIVVNKNRIPGDAKAPTVASGVRLGTNSVALRGMGPAHMGECADVIHRVLSAVKVRGDRDFDLDGVVRQSCLATVKQLCRRFPVPHYGHADSADRS